VELTLINGQDETPEEGFYTVQLASYTVKQNADEVAAGIQNSYIEEADVKGVTYYRLKVKGFMTRDEADKFKMDNSIAFPGALVLGD